MDHTTYMRLALKESKSATEEGNAPFGTVVIDENGQVIWKDHDRVKENIDPTAHAEINAIRGLCRKLNTLKLSSCTFYTTSEPCPTCLSAMIKARVSCCVYGAKTEATASLPIAAETLASYATKYRISIIGGVLEDECLLQREQLLSLQQNNLL